MKTKILHAMILVCAMFAPPSDSAAETVNKSVLMVLWKGETGAEKAFKTRLAELGVNAGYREVNGDQDRGRLANELRGIEPEIAGKFFDAV
ncbi:hypothetical protein JZU48_01030, partial [bacterium]|nr:hypothetical protein [bacterium]